MRFQRCLMVSTTLTWLQMGAGSMFDADADFSAMLNDRQRLTDSQYMVTFSVDEWGTGSVPARNDSSTPERATAFDLENDAFEFNINHSFIYYVIDDAKDLLLLGGLLTDPANENY